MGKILGVLGRLVGFIIVIAWFLIDMLYALFPALVGLAYVCGVNTFEFSVLLMLVYIGFEVNGIKLKKD